MTVTTEDRPRVRPPIDPRIRERRIEVIREAGRRRLRVTLVVTSTIVALGLVYLGVHSPLLNVDHVRVTGAHQETTAQIVRAAGVHKGAALLFVDTRRIAGRIEELPWVQHARVTRDLPGTIRIKITEYAPGVFVRVGAKQVVLAASTGRVIALAHAAPKDAIEVIGEKVAPTVGTMLSPPAVAQVPAALPRRLRAQVRAIDMAPARPGRGATGWAHRDPRQGDRGARGARSPRGPAVHLHRRRRPAGPRLALTPREMASGDRCSRGRARLQSRR